MWPRGKAQPHPSSSFRSGWGRVAKLVIWPMTWLILLCSLGMGQQDIITEIEVNGNRRIPAETIRGRIFTKAGDIYDAAGLERDFNALWNTGYFEDISFEREQTAKGWTLHIIVKERPTIREISYAWFEFGFHTATCWSLQAHQGRLFHREPVRSDQIKKAEVSLRNCWPRAGRQFATIRTEVRQIPPAAVGITFVVKEGPKVKVGKIHFEGNKQHQRPRAAVGNEKLASPSAFRIRSSWKILFAKTYDAYQARRRYRTRPRRVSEPRILQSRRAGSEDRDPRHRPQGIPHSAVAAGPGKAVDITMPIEEGDQYRLARSLSRTTRRSRTPRCPACTHSLSKTATSSAARRSPRVWRICARPTANSGYINFTSVPTPQFDDEKKADLLEIDVDEGKQFYVRRIEFQGNTTTRDKVIRREIALEEGQVYNSQLWEFSLLRLNQLGYFDQLKPTIPT